MNIHFSRTLSRMRKDKKISQREASEHLRISQALLSHYENGLREPGFEFLCRAADYYGCSTDYLLGRTLDKQGISLILDPEEGAEDISGEGRGDERSFKIISSATSMLLELARLSESEELAEAVSTHLMVSYTRLFGLLARNSNMQLVEATAYTAEALGVMCEVCLKLAEHRMLGCMDGDEKLLAFKRDEMSKKYPVRWSAVLTILKEMHNRFDELAEKAG